MPVDEEISLSNIVEIHNSKPVHKKKHITLAKSDKSDISRIHQLCIDDNIIGVSNMILNDKYIIYEKDSSGMTPMFTSYQHGSVKVIRMIRQELTNCYDTMEGLSIHDAAGYNLENVITMMITFGSDVNEKDEYGNTPLYYAIHNESHQSQKILMMFGANC